MVVLFLWWGTGIDLHFLSSHRGKKIEVATSVSTGGSKCPLDTCM